MQKNYNYLNWNVLFCAILLINFLLTTFIFFNQRALSKEFRQENTKVTESLSGIYGQMYYLNSHFSNLEIKLK
ncbi:MAG: hypothetical protein WCT18_03090 [Patescibacteria group bacterium]